MTNYPTWKYRFFRLRYVDTNGGDTEDRFYGIVFYPNAARCDMGGHFQLGIMLGRREAIFDLWRKNAD